MNREEDTPDKPPPLPGPKVRLDLDPERSRANRQIGKAYQALLAVRVYLYTLAAYAAVLGAIALSLATAAIPETLIPAGIVQGLLAAIALTGALRIFREPNLWVMLAAVAQTAFTVYSPGILNYLFTAGTWAAVATVEPARRLMAEYPDLRIARKLRGERVGRRGRR